MQLGWRSALVGVLLVALGACTGAPPAPSATRSEPPAERIYLSLGDSYATGFQPTGKPGDSFADLVARQSGLRLVNLACSGASSAQLRTTPGCAPGNRASNAPDPAGRTQLDAALQVLREHRGRVGLVTIVIGGNDLAPCALQQDPLACATSTVADIRTNLAAVLSALREAAGDAQIVGLTYPDVFLGAWVSPSFPNGQNLARLSVQLFKDFNAALKAEYDKVGAKFVDVTEATGGYGPLTEVTGDPTYGRIPAPVAKVCALTYFCAHTDVHPTPAGHEAIASAVLASG